MPSGPGSAPAHPPYRKYAMRPVPAGGPHAAMEPAPAPMYVLDGPLMCRVAVLTEPEGAALPVADRPRRAAHPARPGLGGRRADPRAELRREPILEATAMDRDRPGRRPGPPIKGEIS